MKEFDFIEKYLKKYSSVNNELILGIGDDAAIVQPNPNKNLVISSDILLENKHFFSDVSAEDLAYKSLAVNISDMSAMGAKPKWVLLSIALPQLHPDWLNKFFDSLYAVLKNYHIQLIGGDTSKGDLTINITIIGEIDRGVALKRSEAKIGDLIYVTGKVGLAVAALHHHFGYISLPVELFSQCEQARLRPTIRVKFAQEISTIAHAALDVSDGLIQDLSHILKSSNVGARVFVKDIPSLEELKKYNHYLDWILSGGDDYELIFTVDPKNERMIKKIAEEHDTEISCIGYITDTNHCELIDDNGKLIRLNKKGFDHFEDE